MFTEILMGAEFARSGADPLRYPKYSFASNQNSGEGEAAG